MIEWVLRYAVGSLFFGLFVIVVDWAQMKFGDRERPMRLDAFLIGMAVWPVAGAIIIGTLVYQFQRKK